MIRVRTIGIVGSLAAAALVAAAAAVASAGALGCGGGAVCGDGVAEGGEQCDDGNDREDDACTRACRAQQTLDAQVIWKLASQELPGFEENCTGVKASKIELVIVGPMNITETIDCSFSQYPFTALTPGSYTVTGRLFDSADQLLTKGQAQAGFEITNADVQVTLNFPFTDFERTDYRGDWFYRFKWGGAATCATATPAVAMARVRIARAGTPVVDESGTPVDGLVPGPCYDFTEQFAHAINDLPWGPAELTVTGLDSGGIAQFEETFPTFIGAGITNPVLEYDVNSLAPDAGGPDAGVVDAAGPDA